jgi:hypothetical protein
VTSELDPQIIINWLNVVGWFAAGFWLLRGHTMRREDFPKIDLHASLRPVVLAPGGRVVEVVVEVENTGVVRHVIRDMKYSLRGAMSKSVSARSDENPEVNLPLKFIEDRELFPESWEYTFVDPGTTSRYRQLIFLAGNADLYELSVKMKYDDPESDFHTAVWFGLI